MPSVFQFLPLLINLALYAVFFRLAARVLRISGVTWLHGFLFSGLLAVFALLLGLAAFLFGELPKLLAFAIGFALQITFGAWFFRERALSSDGQPLGWAGGAKLTALALGFMLLLVLIAIGVVFALLSQLRH